MQDDFGEDLLTLIDDDGKQREFEVLDVIDNDDGCFYALQLTHDDPQEKVETDGVYYIFQTVEENGEQEFVEVEDDALLEKLTQQFEARFEEFYGGEDGEDEDDAEDPDGSLS